MLFAADGDTSILDPRELVRQVTAHVDAHLLGPKIRVFTYKPKRRRKKMRGHRSRLTRVTIQRSPCRPPQVRREEAGD